MKLKNIVFISALALSASLTNFAQETNLIGAWRGTLDAGGTKLRLVFHVTSGADGLTASMDSPDQGVKGIPAAITATKEGALIEVSAIGGKYDGKLDASHAKLAGTWAQGPVSLPLELVRLSPAEAEKALARKANPESIQVNTMTEGKLVGKWAGALDAGAKLRLALKVTKTPDGGLLGSVDSLDQNANDIPATAIVAHDSEIRFDFDTIRSVYVFKLNGAELVGEWRQAGQTFPLTMQKK